MWIETDQVPRLSISYNIFKGNSAQNGGAIAFYNAAGASSSYNVFDGNGQYTPDGGLIYLYSGGGRITFTSSDDVFENSNADNGAIYVYNDSGNWWFGTTPVPVFDVKFSRDKFINNIANNNGGAFYFGDLVEGDNLNVVNSTFQGNDGTGSVAYADDYSVYGTIIFRDNFILDNLNTYFVLNFGDTPSNFKIINNLFVDQSQGINFINLRNYSNPIVVNNTFYGGYNQIIIRSSASGYLVNNILSAAGNYGVWERNSSVDPQVLLNNDFYNAGTCLYLEDNINCLNDATGINGVNTQQGNGNQNNIVADPSFISGSLYKISSSSPCIDAGYDPVDGDFDLGLTQSWLDLDGQPRPYDDSAVSNTVSAWDIGADEYWP